MKKMVLLSLLVLCFPVVTFADTSDSVPDATVASSQEQIFESVPVIDGAIVNSQAADPIEPQNSTEMAETEEAATGEKQKEEITPEKASPKTSQSEETKANQTEKNTTTESESKETLDSTSVALKEAKKTAIAPQAVPITEKSRTVNEKEVTKYWTADKIRDNLTSTNYGINETELKGYSDQELTNAFKLFARYNSDITGMDLGSYVRVLQMVYKDQVISWEDAEKALTFNPHDYTSFADMAKNVDQLQAYLRVLYANEDGFLPLRNFTDEEMLHILTNVLDGTEEQLSGVNGLFSGLVHWLYGSQKGNGPIESEATPILPIQNMSTATAIKPIVQTGTILPTSAVKTAIPAQASSQKEFPKTGERKTFTISVIGIVLFLIAIVVFMKRRARS